MSVIESVLNEPRTSSLKRAVQTPPVGDGELVVRFRRGERTALETLVKRYEHSVLRIAARVVGDALEAEEVRQIVFLKLIQSAASIREPDAVGGWIRRTTITSAINAVRRRKLDRGLKLVLSLGTSAATPRRRPDHIAEQREQIGALAARVNELKPADRALVSLRMEEQLPFNEIGEILNCSGASAKTRFHRILKRLRTMIETPERTPECKQR